ncbi:MAG TPA: hypothetical protein VJY85_02400 [Candidatus Limnocylindria bacterium]|nr:hypothetical protein [Candidatus Limnocylindria bacterium]
MSGRHGRLGRLLLRCYPPAWRERYGDELLDLISDVPLTPRALIDVASSGIALRAHIARRALQGDTVVTIRPAWRHPTAFAVIGALLILPTLFLVASSLLAYELDLTAVRSFVAPIQAALTSVRAVDLLLVLAPALALVAAIAPLLRLGWERRDGTLQAVIVVRALALNVAVGLVAIVLGGVLVWHIVVESVMQAGA